MIVAETAPPTTKRGFRDQFGLPSRSTETTENQWVIMNGHACLLAEGNTSPVNRSVSGISYSENQCFILKGRPCVLTGRNASLMKNTPFGTMSHPRSTETSENQWVIMNGHACLLAEGNTSVVPKRFSSIAYPHSTGIEINLSIPSTVIFGFDAESMIQSFGARWLPDIQSNVRAFEQTAREDHIPEMISTSQSIQTVAAAVFQNVRPLTDKERQRLRRFYNRAYKRR